MAIQKAFRHIPLNQGINDQVDERIAPDGFVSQLNNCIFEKEGRIDTQGTFLPILDPINSEETNGVPNGRHKALHSTDSEDLFAFSEDGIRLKKEGHDFIRIGNQNLFDTENFFISREEDRIHHPDIAIRGDTLMACYQVGPNVHYFLFEISTRSLIRRGIKDDAQDPICLLGDNHRVIVYRNKLEELKTYDVDKKQQNGVGAAPGDDGVSIYKDGDVTQIIKINNNEFLLVSRAYNNDTSLNEVIVTRYSISPAKFFPVAQAIESLSALGNRKDVGKIFVSLSNNDTNIVNVATTVKIGLSSAEIINFEYNLETNSISLSHTLAVENRLDNEITNSFFDEETFENVYQKLDGEIFTHKVGEQPTLRLDSYYLMDKFIMEGKKYYLVGSGEGFYILDENFRFVTKMNAVNTGQFADFRKIRVLRKGDVGYICTPRLTSIEGQFERGFSLHYNSIRLDRDQDRECENFGSYYLITSSPLTFYDGREVTEYGYPKKPTLAVDSLFKR